jgi:uncharacterized protein
VKTTSEAIYFGTVIHRRHMPITHKLRYRVFSCLFDCDRLDALDSRLWLFSHNRFNLFSLYDSDHGDGRPIKEYIHEIISNSEYATHAKKIFMLCYPRVLGYVFNPLTVYYVLDEHDHILLMVYEVRNTFGQRHSYVIPVDSKPGAMVQQEIGKKFYVSPFNDTNGEYHFRCSPPEKEVLVSITLKNNRKTILTASFRGTRYAFNDRTLLRAAATIGLLGVKVITAIHYEALKLWLKGLPIKPRPAPPAQSITWQGDSYHAETKIPETKIRKIA